MSPHATHPSWPYSEECPDCAGYPEEPQPTVGVVLQVVVWLVVIVALAVIVRLAVSR